MRISSTSFPHKDIQKQTWKSPEGSTNNQIDHVMIDKRGASNIMDARNYRGAKSDSDHYLVKVNYICRLADRKEEGKQRIKSLMYKN